MLGHVEVTSNYKGQDKSVVSGEGFSLLGCDWFTHIKLDWSQLNNNTDLNLINCKLSTNPGQT